MVHFSHLVLVFLVSSGRCSSAAPQESEHAVKVNQLVDKIKEMVESRGYPFEQHTVTTEDNYILSLHRIKHGKHGREANRQPVLVQHGLLDSSAKYIARPNSMAYYLADAGYDVWLGNARGNTFSRRHTEKDPDTDASFWDYSFHEMGIKDIPANLQHIKKMTGASKVHYVGFSMGTTQFLVMASMLPQWTLEVVDRVILIAPVAKTRHMSVLSTWVKRKVNWASLSIVRTFGYNELFRYQESPAELAHRICTPASVLVRGICKFVGTRVVTANKELYDFKKVTKDMVDGPAGANVKTYLHFLQIAKEDKFQQYDYQGENNAHYKGQTTPPEYDLSKITKRVHLICGGADRISAKKDVGWLIKELPDAVSHNDSFKSFNHRDFVFNENLENTLYKTMDEILKNNA